MEMIKKWPDLRPYLEKIQRSIDNQDHDIEFKLEDLLSDEWQHITDEKRKIIGKQFFDAVDGRYKFLATIRPTHYPMKASQKYVKPSEGHQ